MKKEPAIIASSFFIAFIQFVLRKLAVSQIFHFFACKFAVVALLEMSKADIADCNSFKFLNRVSHSSKHLTNLTVSAFVD